MNRQERLKINRAAWDAYQADYMQFNLKELPDFFKLLGSGDVMLDDEVVGAGGRRCRPRPAGHLLRVRRNAGLLMDELGCESHRVRHRANGNQDRTSKRPAPQARR